MRHLLTLIAILILASCAKNKTTEAIDNAETNFSEFLDTIPKKSLPIELSCGLQDGTIFTEGFKMFRRFIPASTDRIFGTIESSNEDYRLVIFGQTGDDIYPIIFSFDNKGQIRDSLFLILQGCGGADDTQIPHSFVSIDKDLITLTDTTRFIHIPEGKSGIAVDSQRVTRVLMKLDKNGRFEKQ
jgi:hypothetical protein